MPTEPAASPSAAGTRIVAPLSNETARGHGAEPAGSDDAAHEQDAMYAAFESKPPLVENPCGFCSDNSESILDVCSLTCGYHRKIIVRDASFSLHRGQFACIIGTNGCGKTTLLKTVLGLLPPMGGHALIRGKDIASLSDAERARHIAYIPQAHTPPFPFSVADVVLMGRTPHIGRFSSISHEDKRIAWDALCMLGIEHLAERTYTKLSGGQQQLVLIARALTQQPELIVMDEPTASLDFGNQQIVLSRMKELSNHGATVLMVTHDPGHAVYCANTVVVMKDGRVTGTGTPAEIITKPQMESIYRTPIHVSDIMVEGRMRRICVPL